MNQLPFLAILLGFFLLPHIASTDEKPLTGVTNYPILCGVSPKAKDIISPSADQSEETQSLDLLLEVLTPRQYQQLQMIINKGSLKELIQIDGIAEGRARVIIEARPYREVKELMLNRGFGYSTVASIIMHGSTLKEE